MIVESALDAVFQLIGFFLGKLQTALGVPPDGIFKIPSPLFYLIGQAFAQITAVYPVLIVWWVWRQVKA